MEAFLVGAVGTSTEASGLLESGFPCVKNDSPIEMSSTVMSWSANGRNIDRFGTLENDSDEED